MIDPEVRVKGIGCSEIAPAMGFSAFRAPWEVAYAKRGLLWTPEGGGRDWLDWGHDVEPAILGWYARTQKKTLKLELRTQKHPELPITYTPDATVEGEPRGVDAKNVGWAHADEWRDGPSIDAYLQAQGYMLCMDLEEYDLAASICGAVPQIHTVRRDEGVIAMIRRRIPAFWERYVVSGEELPLDGSAEASAWLQRRYPRHQSDIRKAKQGEADRLLEYEQLRISQDELSIRRATLENELKGAIADHEGIRHRDLKFTWKRTRDSEVTETDWKSMAIGLRNQFMPDQAEQKKWEEFYTTTRSKEGSRRIYFTSAAYKEAKKRNKGRGGEEEQEEQAA